jgi:hypothetical protein
MEDNREFPTDQSHGPDGNKICPYFLKGTCRQLSNCKWLHPSGVDVPQQHAIGKTDLNSKLCPYFATGTEQFFPLRFNDY